MKLINTILIFLAVMVLILIIAKILKMRGFDYPCEYYRTYPDMVVPEKCKLK